MTQHDGKLGTERHETAQRIGSPGRLFASMLRNSISACHSPSNRSNWQVNGHKPAATKANGSDRALGVVDSNGKSYGVPGPTPASTPTPYPARPRLQPRPQVRRRRRWAGLRADAPRGEETTGAERGPGRSALPRMSYRRVRGVAGRPWLRGSDDFGAAPCVAVAATPAQVKNAAATPSGSIGRRANRREHFRCR